MYNVCRPCGDTVHCVDFAAAKQYVERMGLKVTGSAMHVGDKWLIWHVLDAEGSTEALIVHCRT